MLEGRERTVLRKYAPDVLGDEMLMRPSRHYVLWAIVSLSLPTALAFAFTGTGYGALEGLLWGGFARVFLTQHATFALNSFAHVFGTRRFDTAEGSRNNWVLGIVLGGEGWHNNHHAFPSSAVNGLYWWEVDPCGWLILLFERLGWAKKVRRPSKEQVASRARFQAGAASTSPVTSPNDL